MTCRFRIAATLLFGLATAGAHAGTITALSRSAPDSVFDSANGASDAQREHAISADGRYVVFVSSATNLASNQYDVNGQADAFLLDRNSGAIRLITHRWGQPARAGNGTAIGPIIDASGTHVAFVSSATDLLQDPLPDDSSQRLFVYDIAADTLTLVDRHLGDPTLAASFSGGPVLSDDGTWLVFGSSATDLVADQDDSNNSVDVFLYNTSTGNLRLVSHTPSLFGDTSTGNGGSGGAVMSADGRWIAYVSSASNLVQGLNDNNDADDILLFDRDAPSNNPTQLVTRATGPLPASANGASANPTIAANGSAIAYTTQATNLQAGVVDANGDSDVYMYDRMSHVNTLVSHDATSTTQASVMYSGNPKLSPDGRYVLHTSASNNVIVGQVDASRSDDLFLFDRNDLSLKLVNHKTGSTTQTASNESKYGFFSADGSHIMFDSRGTNLVLGQVDTNDDGDPLLGNDVYLALTANPSADARLISHAPGQPPIAGKRMSYTPSVTPDASLVVYVSESDELPGPGVDFNARTDLLLWNSATDANTLLTRRALPGDPATLMGASQVVVSGDGNWIAFVSRSPAIVTGENDTNREDDLYLLERATGAVRLVSHVPNDPLKAGNRGVALTSSTNVSISDNGRWIAFESNASDLADGELDNNLEPDVLLFDRDAPAGTSLKLVSRKTAGGAGNAGGNVPRIAADGSAIVFQSISTNLIAGVADSNALSDVYRYDVATATLQLVSHSAASATTTASTQGKEAVISADGRYIAYLADSTDLVTGQSDGNGTFDVFLYDAQAGTNRLVSHAAGAPTTAAGAPGRVNQAPVLSAAGDYIAWASEAANLVPNFQNNIQFPIGPATQVYRWTRATDTTQLISHAVDGFGNPSGDAAARQPSLSGDGHRVAYVSAAENLIDGVQDGGLTDDAFLWDADANTTTLITHVAGQPLSATGSARTDLSLTRDGARILFASTDASVASGVTSHDSQQHLYLYNIAADVSVLLSPRESDSHATARDYAERASIDTSAASIAYLSPSPDLVSFDGNANGDAFGFRRGTGVPQLTAPGDLTLPEDQVAGPLAIPASDPDGPRSELTLQVTSSDTSLLPPENIAVSRTMTGFAFTTTPTAEASGTTTVSLRLIDADGNAASGSFVLTWTAVNDPPTLGVPTAQTIAEDTVLGPLDIAVGDVESGPDGVIVTATSSNQAIVHDANILIDGPGCCRALTITPAQDAYGDVTISVRAVDPADSSVTTVATFDVHVTPVNDAPFVIAPLNLTIPENGENAPAYFGLADLETPVAGLILSFASSNPALLPTSRLSVAGTGAIRTLVARPLPNTTGTATITLTVADPDGAARSASFTVTVQAATQNADLIATLANHRDWITAGSPVTWTVHVHNAGPDAVTGARVVDALPPGSENATWTCVPGSGAACRATTGSGPVNAVIDLAAGADVDVLVTFTPTAVAGSTYAYAIEVQPAPNSHEASLANNTATDDDRYGDFIFVDAFEARE